MGRHPADKGEDMKNKVLRMKHDIKKYAMNNWFHLNNPKEPLLKADKFIDWLKKYHQGIYDPRKRSREI